VFEMITVHLPKSGLLLSFGNFDSSGNFHYQDSQDR